MRWMMGIALVAFVLKAAPAQDRRPAQPNEQDRRFVLEASAWGLGEVNLSHIAAQWATRQEVKDFARQMVEEHRKANQELLNVLNKKGLRAASTMPASHQNLANRLYGLRGADRDRAYLEQMVKDHEAAVKLFEAQAEKGQDPELKEWASKMLPALKKHHETLRKLAEAKDRPEELRKPDPDKDRIDKEKADKEKADREKADKEKADKEKADKEKKDKENKDKENKDKPDRP
jgi:putative membrane protein